MEIKLSYHDIAYNHRHQAIHELPTTHETEGFILHKCTYMKSSYDMGNKLT